MDPKNSNDGCFFHGLANVTLKNAVHLEKQIKMYSSLLTNGINLTFFKQRKTKQYFNTIKFMIFLVFFHELILRDL